MILAITDVVDCMKYHIICGSCTCGWIPTQNNPRDNEKILGFGVDSRNFVFSGRISNKDFLSGEILFNLWFLYLRLNSYPKKPEEHKKI